MKSKSCVLCVLCVSVVIPLLAQTERTITPGGKGPNRLNLDVALLAASRLNDLRLYDKAGKEVPYLLVPPPSPEPRWKDGKILPVAATKETSGFELDLGATIICDRLRLTGIRAPFLKRLKLEAGGDRSHWTLLVGEGTLFDLPGEKLRKTELAFEAGPYRFFRLTWDDRKSGVVRPPLTASARLREPLAAPPPLRAPVEFARRGPQSRFAVRLPGPHLPLVAIEVGVSGGHLLRPARVIEARLSGSEVIPILLGSRVLRRTEQGELSAADLRIPIAAPEGRELEVVAEDGNNPPLNLTSISIEFMPLPWIYFESASEEPLVARYGNATLAAPQYDLEAMRPYIGRAPLLEARWGESHDLHPQETVFKPEALPPSGGAIDPVQFRYARKIPVAPPGMAALTLDAAVLAHCRPDLADVRIADVSGKQVPFLLEKREDPLVIHLPPPGPEAKSLPGQSRYQINLPYETLPESKLVLTTTARVFERRVSIQIRRPAPDARSEPTLEAVAEALWLHTDPETAAPSLEIELRPLGVRQAILVIDEGDNSALPISGANLELRAYRLRFFSFPGADLTLYYGSPSLAPPRYDLALLAPRLVGISGHELSPGPETTATAPPGKADDQKKLFWGVLIAAVVFLLVLLMRLLRSKESPQRLD